MERKLFDEFMDILDREDKDGAMTFVFGLLESERLTIEELYEELLTPSLTQFACKLADAEICIWKEHTRTSIVRTILEATYSYISKRKAGVPQLGKSVLVVCPQEEYHEIGAIMATHYFLLTGFQAQYIGANTPKEEIISAIRALKPDYLALSVTNYYNLFSTKKLTETLKENYPGVKIIIGGQAFLQEKATDQIHYDIHIRSLPDIFALSEEAKR